MGFYYSKMHGEGSAFCGNPDVLASSFGKSLS